VVFVDGLNAATLRTKVIHWSIKWSDEMERAQKH